MSPTAAWSSRDWRFRCETATPNLAVGSIAGLAGALFAHLATTDRWSWWAAGIATVALCAVAGLIMGLVTAALSVPAWAVTIAATVLFESAALGISHGRDEERGRAWPVGRPACRARGRGRLTGSSLLAGAGGLWLAI